ncbi:transcriptional regulator AsnC [Psychrobium sp. 1_MG-2023]|uniref:transcriptional regulator AsnC n=1 Tax=Psychrobium sp. 1_MG-2023 TaxID=3062624 RepID=UPI000C348212|nr:transcriptional regulator AsnC [Psychrobium sp. 1_MG-2023]MDP2559719.1 transcriptional regulator AsnC [Psychrobium sp. 1_MG-2023]PKF59548.1 transcriptional regulator AsnC [Alteromonadales bacterium alter-6D02]
MNKHYQIDNLDKNILNALRDNARSPYAELGKRFAVSPATVHVRVEKMKQAGIIAKTKVELNGKALGYDVCCFIGINLKAAGDYQPTIAKLENIEEVLEAYYTTGHYNIFVKIMAKSIDHLHRVLINKIQAIDEIQSTETLISLDNPINREVTP